MTPDPNAQSAALTRTERLVAAIRRHPRLAGVVAVLALLLATAAVLHVAADHSLTEARAAALAEGDPLTLAELEARRPAIPPERNMALLLLEAGDRLKEGNKRLPASDEFKEQEIAVPIWGNAPPRIPPGVRWDAAVLATGRTILDAHRPALEKIEEACRLERGRYPIELKSPPFATLLPHLTMQRQLAKLLGLRALEQAQQGKSAEAADDVERLLRMSRTLESESFIISHLVRIACDALAVQTAVSILNLGPMDAAHLERLAAGAAEAEARADLHAALVGERAIFDETVGWTKMGGLQSITSWGVEDNSVDVVSFFYHLIPGLAATDRASGLRILNEVVAASRLPPAEALARMNALSNAPQLATFYCILTRILVPSLTRSFELTYRNVSQLRCFRAAAAAEAYRLKHNAWPSSLDELVPAFLPAVPADPLSGKPLRFARDERGIVIWPDGDQPTESDETARPKQGDRRILIRLLDPALRGRTPPPTTSRAG